MFSNLRSVSDPVFSNSCSNFWPVSNQFGVASWAHICSKVVFNIGRRTPETLFGTAHIVSLIGAPLGSSCHRGNQSASWYSLVLPSVPLITYTPRSPTPLGQSPLTPTMKCQEIYICIYVYNDQPTNSFFLCIPSLLRPSPRNLVTASACHAIHVS